MDSDRVIERNSKASKLLEDKAKFVDVQQQAREKVLIAKEKELAARERTLNMREKAIRAEECAIKAQRDFQVLNQEYLDEKEAMLINTALELGIAKSDIN